MPCDQYIINGPPNEPVLFCSLGLPASIVCCRLYRCRRAAGRPRGRSGGRHSIAGQYCYVPSGRQLVLICKNKKRVGQNYRGALSSSTCNMWYNFYDATRQVPATIGWVVYEQAWPGRVLGSGNISVGRYAAGPVRVYCTFCRVLLCRARPDFRQDQIALPRRLDHRDYGARPDSHSTAAPQPEAPSFAPCPSPSQSATGLSETYNMYLTIKPATEVVFSVILLKKKRILRFSGFFKSIAIMCDLLLSVAV